MKTKNCNNCELSSVCKIFIDITHAGADSREVAIINDIAEYFNCEYFQVKVEENNE